MAVMRAKLNPIDEEELNLRVYLKRRHQRRNALEKVIKEWDRLKHSEWLSHTLEACRSATERHDYVPDHLLDLIGDWTSSDEHSLGVAIDRLSVANKRLHDAIDAMDGLNQYSDQPNATTMKAPNGKHDMEQVRNIRKVATDPPLQIIEPRLSKI